MNENNNEIPAKTPIELAIAIVPRNHHRFQPGAYLTRLSGSKQQARRRCLTRLQNRRNRAKLGSTVSIRYCNMVMTCIGSGHLSGLWRLCVQMQHFTQFLDAAQAMEMIRQTNAPWCGAQQTTKHFVVVKEKGLFLHVENLLWCTPQLLCQRGKHKTTDQTHGKAKLKRSVSDSLSKKEGNHHKSTGKEQRVEDKEVGRLHESFGSMIAYLREKNRFTADRGYKFLRDEQYALDILYLIILYLKYMDMSDHEGRADVKRVLLMLREVRGNEVIHGVKLAQWIEHMLAYRVKFTERCDVDSELNSIIERRRVNMVQNGLLLLEKPLASKELQQQLQHSMQCVVEKYHDGKIDAVQIGFIHRLKSALGKTVFLQAMQTDIMDQYADALLGIYDHITRTRTLSNKDPRSLHLFLSIMSLLSTYFTRKCDESVMHVVMRQPTC